TLPEAQGLGRQRPLVGLHPGAKAPARFWESHRWARVADQLSFQHSAEVVLLGGPGEEAIADEIQQHAQHPLRNLAGRTTLSALAAALTRLDLLIALDSGPGHMAAALGTPSVVIYGPGNPVRWRALDQAKH